MPLRSHVRTAVEVPRWALGFYGRHLLLIVGISLIPAAERFLGRLADTPQPAMEILTTSARLVLLFLVVRLAIVRDPVIARAGSAPLRRHVGRFYRRHWPSLLVQLLMLGAALLVFDVIPDQVIGAMIPESAAALYFAVLLAVKNPTVIAFTFVWMVGVARQPLLWAALDREREAAAAEAGREAGRA